MDYREKKRLDPSWTPYCLVCTSIKKMLDRPYGYQCRDCKNEINFDMLPLWDDDNDDNEF